MTCIRLKSSMFPCLLLHKWVEVLTFMSVGVTKQRLEGRGLMVAIFVSTGELFWACVISSTLSANGTDTQSERLRTRRHGRSLRPKHKPVIRSAPLAELSHQNCRWNWSKCWKVILLGAGGGYEDFDEIICPAVEAVQAFPNSRLRSIIQVSGTLPQRWKRAMHVCLSSLPLLVLFWGLRQRQICQNWTSPRKNPPKRFCCWKN